MKDQFQKWSRHVFPDHDFAAKLVDLILKREFTSKVKKSKSLSARYERCGGVSISLLLVQS